MKTIGKALSFLTEMFETFLGGGLDEATTENAFLREFPDSTEAERIRAERKRELTIARIIDF